MQLGTKLGYFFFVSFIQKMWYGVRFSKEAHLPPIRAAFVCFGRTLVLWTQSTLAVAHRAQAHRIRYIFWFSEETSEFYRLILELNDFWALRPKIFLCLTKVRSLARWCPSPLFPSEYTWSSPWVLLGTARLRSTDCTPRLVVTRYLVVALRGDLRALQAIYALCV
jgi:hypothetical protein